MRVNDVNLHTINHSCNLSRVRDTCQSSESCILAGPCCRVLDHSDWTVLHSSRRDSSSARQAPVQDSLERNDMSDERISSLHMCLPSPFRFRENRTNFAVLFIYSYYHYCSEPAHCTILGLVRDIFHNSHGTSQLQSN